MRILTPSILSRLESARSWWCCVAAVSALYWIVFGGLPLALTRGKGCVFPPKLVVYETERGMRVRVDRESIPPPESWIELGTLGSAYAGRSGEGVWARFECSASFSADGLNLSESQAAALREEAADALDRFASQAGRSRYKECGRLLRSGGGRVSERAAEAYCFAATHTIFGAGMLVGIPRSITLTGRLRRARLINRRICVNCGYDLDGCINQVGACRCPECGSIQEITTPK